MNIATTMNPGLRLIQLDRPGRPEGDDEIAQLERVMGRLTAGMSSLVADVRTSSAYVLRLGDLYVGCGVYKSLNQRQAA